MQNTDTKEIEFLSAKSHDFRKKELDSISVELLNPNTFIQSLFLKSGKIVGKKIISDALLSANYCFIDDENLKDLKKLLSQDQINLSNIIVSIINQAENVNGINLTSAIIDKIEYHFRDNTFHFIFNVSNNFLSGKSKLTIEVPRMALENIKLPDMKEIYVNQWYIIILIYLHLKTKKFFIVKNSLLDSGLLSIFFNKDSSYNINPIINKTLNEATP